MAALFLPPPLDIVETVRSGSPQVRPGPRPGLCGAGAAQSAAPPQGVTRPGPRLRLPCAPYAAAAANPAPRPLLGAPTGHRRALAKRRAQPRGLARGRRGRPADGAPDRCPRQRELGECQRGAGGRAPRQPARAAHRRAHLWQGRRAVLFSHWWVAQSFPLGVGSGAGLRWVLGGPTGPQRAPAAWQAPWLPPKTRLTLPQPTLTPTPTPPPPRPGDDGAGLRLTVSKYLTPGRWAGRRSGLPQTPLDSPARCARVGCGIRACSGQQHPALNSHGPPPPS
jgi:hypothetical protein